MTDQTVNFQTDEQAAPACDYFLLARHVAHILALPPDPERWTTDQTQEAEDMINEGLRMVYTPPIVDHWGHHSWSFTNPIGRLTTTSGQQWYALPIDFDHMAADGCFTYVSTSNSYGPIELTSESRLRKLSSATDTQSYPHLAALRYRFSDGATIQRAEVGFYHVPDSTYELEFPYHAVPYAISRTRPYPIGAQSHGLLFVMAVEAAAEMYENDGPGHRYQRFMEQLKTEIQKDAKMGARRLGYNRNTNLWKGPGRRSELNYQQNVTYNSTSYDNT